MVRLVNAQNRNDKYLALSYCWGQTGKLPPRLLTSNINEMYTGIAVSSLPMTFQDAVGVVMELQLSHIWIDSLCIIQDAEEDKQNEIGRMGEIFANSHLTIAATDGIDSFAGLFHTSRTIPKIRIGWNDSAAKRDHWVHLRMNRYEYPIFASGSERSTHGCLEKRAWTFQERILSPRVVHFTSKQLKWECNCRNTYEFSEQPDFDPESELSFNLSFQIGQKTKLAHVLRSDASKHHVYEIWYRLLEEYSILDMSFDGDKINAIKGIAEATSDRLGDSLIHGIWQNDVRQGLLWSLRPNDDTLERIKATDLPVPSWSWAKTHGRLGCINLPPGSNTLCPSSATIDSTQMEQGILALDAQCKSGTVEDELFLAFDGTFRVHLHLDSAFGLVTKKSRRRISSDEKLLIRQEVHCCHIGTWLTAERGGGTFYGLALLPIGDIKDGIYKRVGMFSTTRLDLSEITSTWQRQRLFLV
jgi:hypothetical protein